MDVCFSAGVMAWHEFTVLKEIDWISKCLLGFVVEKYSCLLHLVLIEVEA